MRDIGIIMKAMHEAQALLGTYIEPRATRSRRLSCKDAGDTGPGRRDRCTGPVEQRVWAPESCTITQKGETRS